MTSLLRRFLADTSAASAVEYGLLSGTIACFGIAALQSLGVKLSAKFGKINAALS